METNDLITQLNSIFREVFDKKDLVVHEAMTAAEVDNWDSYNHINLIMTIEEKFGIQFALSELKDLKNVGALMQLIRQKIPTA